MTSTIKVNTVKDTASTDIIKKCGTSITVGTASDTTTVAGNAVRSNALQASDGQNIISQTGTTITLGASGDTIALSAGANQTGFGRTGTVDWITTPKTATFTAVSGEGYFCNTSGGAFTVNLPAGSAGAIVSLADYAATWQTSNVTVSPNGTDKIGSVSANVVLSTEGQSVTLVFVDSTQGWINTMDSTSNVRGSSFLAATVSGACNTLVTAPCCANTKIATFTGPGDFTVTSTALCAAQNIVSHLIVAGGASGGTGCSGGGGGAGGFREVKNPITPYTASPLDGYSTPANRVTVTAQAYPIVVGGGGAGVGGQPNGNPSSGNNGNNSSFGGIVSAGGGGGGGDAPTPATGKDGGSGGGGGHSGGGSGNGNTPPVSPSQGQPGRQSEPSTGPAPSDAGGGAGGATVAGTPGSTGHQGGAGATTSISASATTYAGGGGGSNRCGGSAPDVAGGSGGGGKGAAGPRPRPAADATGQNGTDNTGGGGGAGGSLAPGGTIGGTGTGGSGIVIIRYKFQ